MVFFNEGFPYQHCSSRLYLFMRSPSHHSFVFNLVTKGKQTNKYKIFGLTGLFRRQTLLRKHGVYLFVLLDVCRWKMWARGSNNKREDQQRTAGRQNIPEYRIYSGRWKFRLDCHNSVWCSTHKRPLIETLKLILSHPLSPSTHLWLCICIIYFE